MITKESIQTLSNEILELKLNQPYHPCLHAKIQQLDTMVEEQKKQRLKGAK